MDYGKAIGSIHDDLAGDNVEAAVMGCVRVARAAKDHLNAATFLHELYLNRNELARLLYADVIQLTADARKFIHETSFERWIELHTIEDLDLSKDVVKDKNDRRNVLKVSIGEIDPELARWQQALSDMVVPPGMSAVDTASLSERFINEKRLIRSKMRALQIIKARVKARCLNYAVQMERQIELQQKGQGFLDGVQNEVNNYFKGRSDDVYRRLQKATQLATSPDLEDASLLLTQVRRTLKAAADFFYPPVEGAVTCADGVERNLGDKQYLNRLQQFLATCSPRSTTHDLLRAELDHLASFFRRLNEMASKGVHASVTLAESKQGLVGLYFFLFNICRHLLQDGQLADG